MKTDKQTGKNGQDSNERDSHGRFSKGNKSSKGRPVGASKQTLLRCREYAEKLLPTLYNEAEQGNLKAIEMIFAHGLPKLKTITVAEAIPQNPNGIIQAMTDGTLDTDTALQALNAHLTGLKITEIAEMKKIIEELEKKIIELEQSESKR